MRLFFAILIIGIWAICSIPFFSPETARSLICFESDSTGSCRSQVRGRCAISPSGLWRRGLLGSESGLQCCRFNNGKRTISRISSMLILCQILAVIGVLTNVAIIGFTSNQLSFWYVEPRVCTDNQSANIRNERRFPGLSAAGKVCAVGPCLVVAKLTW